MAFSFNRVQLAGNLTRDPQVRFLANERAVANFGLAVNRRYKTNDGQQKEEVVFVDVEAWGRTGELVGQYLTKGRACFVEGRLRLDQWEDKNDHQKRSRLVVVADNVHFLDSPRGQGPGGPAGEPGEPGDTSTDAAPASGASRPAAPAGAAQPLDDEPPF